MLFKAWIISTGMFSSFRWDILPFPDSNMMINPAQFRCALLIMDQEPASVADVSLRRLIGVFHLPVDAACIIHRRITWLNGFRPLGCFTM